MKGGNLKEGGREKGRDGKERGCGRESGKEGGREGRRRGREEEEGTREKEGERERRKGGGIEGQERERGKEAGREGWREGRMEGGRDEGTISVSFRKRDKGGKIILWENLGGRRDCAQQCSLYPPRKFLNFRPSEISSGAFFRPFVAFK